MDPFEARIRLMEALISRPKTKDGKVDLKAWVHTVLPLMNQVPSLARYLGQGPSQAAGR